MSPGKLVDEKDVGCQDKSGPGKIHEVILVFNATGFIQTNFFRACWHVTSSIWGPPSPCKQALRYSIVPYSSWNNDVKKRQRWHIFENHDKPLNSQNNYSPRSHNITQQLPVRLFLITTKCKSYWNSETNSALIAAWAFKDQGNFYSLDRFTERYVRFLQFLPWKNRFNTQ